MFYTDSSTHEAIEGLIGRFTSGQEHIMKERGVRVKCQCTLLAHTVKRRGLVSHNYTVSYAFIHEVHTKHGKALGMIRGM